MRIVPLVARSHEQIYPALSIEALRTAVGASSFVIRGTGASGEADTGQPAMTALKVGDFEVPTGPAGDFRVYFSGMPSMTTISAASLLDPAKAAQYADARRRPHRPDRHQRGRAPRSRGDAARIVRRLASRCTPRSSTRF